MNTLGNIWESYTHEFSTVQKVVIGVVLAMIVIIAVMAIVMIIMEMTK